MSLIDKFKKDDKKDKEISEKKQTEKQKPKIKPESKQETKEECPFCGELFKSVAHHKPHCSKNPDNKETDKQIDVDIDTLTDKLTEIIDKKFNGLELTKRLNNLEKINKITEKMDTLNDTIKNTDTDTTSNIKDLNKAKLHWQSLWSSIKKTCQTGKRKEDSQFLNEFFNWRD